MKDILLVTPPFTQINTPYPATVYLKGFLDKQGISNSQVDLGIEVILELFSRSGLQGLFQYAEEQGRLQSQNAKRMYALRHTYIKVVDDVIRFLQGKNASLARQINTGNFLPQAARFSQLDDLDWVFGNMGLQDKAKHLATFFIEDISDFIIECVDENFGFSRYAESLAMSANSFDELYEKLRGEASYVDASTRHILDAKLSELQPKMVGFAVPFPGNLYSALKCGQFIKEKYPHIVVVMGGGFPNTELRSLKDTRVFEFMDFITLDDGERPLELLWKHIVSNEAFSKSVELKRTFTCMGGEVTYINNSSLKDYPQNQLGTPNYKDLLLDKYISVIEVANPMHSLWSDGRWNKLTMAHGCYWGRCTFCDVSLDYIKLYEPIAAKLLVDRMEEIIAQTGETGFHFVDEAAPPAMMRAVAVEIIQRELSLTWWTNIRFEKSFTKDLCQLLQASGCIAVSGGVEVASKRILSLINKGVSLEQLARVCDNFSEAGIMTHAYLMFGFPTQTVQETMDSLEVVRQLFEMGVVQSGFWHQFSLTAHSPVGLNAQDYHIEPVLKEITFAHNDIEFRDKTEIDHTRFSQGLKTSLYNYMHGLGFDIPLQQWFQGAFAKRELPQTTIAPDFIAQCLNRTPIFSTSHSAMVIWIGEVPESEVLTKTKRGQTRKNLKITVHHQKEDVELTFAYEKGAWLIDILKQTSVYGKCDQTFGTLKDSYEKQFDDFELFWYSKPVQSLHKLGLLVL